MTRLERTREPRRLPLPRRAIAPAPWAFALAVSLVSSACATSGASTSNGLSPHGLTDADEVLTTGTDPLDDDTDDGGVGDGVEVTYNGTDPLDGTDDYANDADGDGLSAEAEADLDGPRREPPDFEPAG